MQTTRKIAIYITAVIIVAVAGALLGWYYYLRSTTDQTSAIVAARGLNNAAPAFTGTTGSTEQNIAETTSGGAVSSTRSASSSPAALWEVSSTPVAGADFVGSTTLTYVARSTGFVFTADPRTHAVVRETNTLRPMIYRAYFAPDGRVIERSLTKSGGIETFVGTMGTSSATSTDLSLIGADLGSGVDAVAVDPAGPSILYTQQAQGSGVLGMTSDWGGTKQTRLFTEPLSQWRLWWLADGRVIISQKPADGVEGYAYEVGKGGSLTLLAQGEGLTILPRPDSTALLIGTSPGNGTLSLSALPSAKSQLETLSIATVAGKCVWAPGTSLIAYCAVPQNIPSGNFLDDWYRGTVHTSDSWWRIDVLSGSTTPLAVDAAGAPPLDVVHPVIDANGTHIAFENARDDSLWVLTIPR